MSVVAGPKIVDNGLILHFDAANIKSYPGTGNTVIDIVGNNDCTLANGASVSSGDMTFDGINDKATFNMPHDNTVTALTYELVFKGSRMEDYSYIFHNNGSDATTGTSWCTFGWYAGTNNIYAAFDGKYASMYDNTTSINSNTYYHLALTWDNLTQIFYINGVNKKSVGQSGITKILDTTTSLCNEKNNTHRRVNGNISLVRIYNRALSNTEINQNFNALKGRYGL